MHFAHPRRPLPVAYSLSTTALLPDTPGRERSPFVFHPYSPLPKVRAVSRYFRRSSFIALLLLAILSVLTLIYRLNFVPPNPSDPYGHAHKGSNASRNHIVMKPLAFNTRAFEQRRQVVLSEQEELAAVILHIASLNSNALPLFVDPSKPIDPQLVCGFDTRGERAIDEVQSLRDDAWNQHPIVLFKDLRSPLGREVVSMLDELNLSPPPTVIDVDQRPDASILKPLLKRLTSAPTLPILLISGELAAPTITQLRSLHESGELHRLIARSGAIIDGGKRKRRGAR